MATHIDSSARVEPGAQLGSGVSIGAYAFVGAGVVLGDGTRLHHHASVEGAATTLGKECEVFPYANIGARTQDLKYGGGKPGLQIGHRNIFREYVSVNCATNDGEFTRIGDDNAILAYSHVAHDCVLGNGIVMSNGVQLAGHVVIEDHVVIGGYGGVHQFCRVGTFAMLSAMAKLVQDLPPFFIADGIPATVRAFNKVGLTRQGYKADNLERVKQIYRILYRDGHNRTQAVEKLAAHPDAGTPEFKLMLDFAGKSERGLIGGG